MSNNKCRGCLFCYGYFSVRWRRLTGARFTSIRKAIGRAQENRLDLRMLGGCAYARCSEGLQTARNPLDRITKMCVGTGGDTDILNVTTRGI